MSRIAPRLCDRTKTQARFDLPDDHDFPEQLAVRSERGWTTLALTSQEELALATEFLEERLERVGEEGGRVVLAGD